MYDSYHKKTPKKSRKKKKKEKDIINMDGNWSSNGEDNEENQTVEVNRGKGEMPEGAQDSDGADTDNRDQDDPHRALDINLDE